MLILRLGFLPIAKIQLKPYDSGVHAANDQDKERFIGVVDTLDYTDKQVRKNLFNDTLKNGEKREQGSTV
jgi:hypothetical protein